LPKRHSEDLAQRAGRRFRLVCHRLSLDPPMN
jgi:hypothetical protein